MKRFTNVREALRYAAAGGQALHVYGALPGHFPGAPGVFKRYSVWAHLLDWDLERLVRTARGLGVRVIRVDRRGLAGQHIDLCGGPLEMAVRLCAGDER